MRVLVPENAVRSVPELRARMEQLQGRRMDAAVLPAHPALAALLPGGGLRAGSSYSLAPSPVLLSALLAPPSQHGSWCAVVGWPEFGTEAAAGSGVVLERTVLVPSPGPRWMSVVATLAEVMPLIAVRPPGRVSDAEAARLAARLRDRGAALLVQGSWPQADAALELADPHWSGAGRGQGYLTRREVTVTVWARRSPAPRRDRLLLPDATGGLDRLETAAEARLAPTRPDRALVGSLRAVG